MVKKRKKKKSTVLKFILLFVLLFILGVASYAFVYLSSFSKNAKAENKHLNTKPVQSNEPVNILLLGVDIGTPGATNKNDPKRTDTMLLVNYNPKNSKVNVVSIPRDTLIKLNGRNSKINEAHAQYGVNGAIDAVEKLLGVSINFYGKIDYSGFDKVIDALGGVDMQINSRMDYDDPGQNLHIHFKKGSVVHLDGKKAEEFFRWRKNNDGTGLANGDLDRIKNQHLFIEKVMEKIKSPSIITKLPDILKIIPEYAETNMEATDILKYGLTLAKTGKDSMNYSTIKGEAKYIDNVSYVVYDKKENLDLLAALKGEGKVAEDKKEDIDKSKLKVKVNNCTSKNGIASRFSDSLKDKGYSNITIGNSSHRKTSAVYINPNKNLKDLVSSDFDISTISNITDNSDYDIIVMLGDNYNK